MKKILVPTDFTYGSVNAYEYALELAQKLEAKVTLYHVYNEEDNRGHRPRSLTEALEQAEEELALDALAGYGYSVQQELGIEVENTYILDRGRPVKAIVDYADFMEADLIVMGTWWAEGASGVMDSWWGSVATKVIEQSRRAVLLIPENCRYHAIQHIAYATNFREKEQRVPAEIKSLAPQPSLKISVLNLKRTDTAYDPVYFSFLEAIYKLEMDNFNLQFYTINHENPLEGLNQFVAKEKVDLLTLLTHERLTILDRILGPSLVQRMAFHSHIPLLILHQ